MVVTFQWGIDRSETGMAKTGEARQRVVDTCAVAAECVAMFMFVIIGCGVAIGGATHLEVAFAFGMGIMVLAYAIGHHSGGQINCAVTLSLVLGGQVPWYQGIANVLAQLVGSVLGACFLCIIFPCDADQTQTLGTNIVSPVYGQGRALAAEIFGTLLLCYVVWETAVSTKSKAGKNACIAIGFAVFLAHLILLPIDGCSINPTRSFGPAIVGYIRNCPGRVGGCLVDGQPCEPRPCLVDGKPCREKGLEDLWVMWLGPLIGAALAAALQFPFLRTKPSDKVIPS